MPLNLPTVPSTLNNKSWQKEKGMLAKLAGETGVGDELTKLEKALQATNWDKLNVSLSYKTEEILDQAIEAAKSEWSSKYAAIARALGDSKSVALVAAKKYDLTKGVPKSAAAAARKVAEDANSYGEALHAYPAKMMQEFQSRRAKFLIQKKELGKIGANMFVEARAAINTVKKTAVFDSKSWNKLRTVGTQVPTLPWAAKYAAQAKALFSVGPEKVTKEQLPSHVSKMEHLLGELEKIAPK